MPDWAAIAILAVLALIPGRLLIALLARKEGRFDGDGLAMLFASFLAGVILTGWLALLLAEIGLFSPGILAFVWLALTALLAVLLLRRRPAPSQEVGLDSRAPAPTRVQLLSFLPSWSEYVFLGVWFLAALWLFFRPHQFLLGGADAGVYVSLAASIRDEGSILIQDETLADVDPGLYPALLRPLPEKDRGTVIAPYYLFPGFYITDAELGKVMPQFYPLHPVWQAAAYTIGGVDASLMMTGLWALLAGLAVYLVIRELAGWEAAALGLAGLTLTALQVWFARYPTTEMLTQFLLWGGIWCTLLWLRRGRPRALWPLLAGASLGEVLLVRIDTYFLLAIPFFIWFYLRWSGRWKKEDWWFFISLLALTVHSLIHAQLQSTPYFYNTFGYGFNLVKQDWLVPLLGLLLVTAALLFLGRYRPNAESISHFKRPILIAVVAIVIISFLFGFFVRPNLGEGGGFWNDWYGGGQIPTNLDRENLVRLSWYLSPLGILLAAIGICLMIWQVDARSAVVFGTGLFFAAFYLWRIQANPHQIYTMRRYVPAVLPFFTIAAAYFLGWLLNHQRRSTALSGVVLAVLWLGSLAWSARGFVSQVDYKGLVQQIEEIDSQLEPGSVLLFDDQNPITQGDVIGTSLQYLYGHSVFSLRNRSEVNQSLLQSWLAGLASEGRAVYWVGDPAFLGHIDVTWREAFTENIRVKQLESTYQNKPYRILDFALDLRFNQIEPE